MPNYFENLISGGHFDLSSMMGRVDKIPFTPRQAQRFFSEVPVDTLVVSLEERSETRTLVQTSRRGAAGDTKIEDRRKLRYFELFHIQRNDAIYADEVQGIREYATPDQLQTIDSKLNRKMGIHQRDIDATIEHMCMTALQGLTKDADGTTLLDLEARMGVTLPTEVNFDFDVSANDPQKIAAGIVRTSQDVLGDIVPTRYHALCGPSFMDDLTHHEAVNLSFQRALASMDAAAATAGLGDWMRMSHVRTPPFYWGGIWWEEYRGGSSYISDDKAVIFPVFDGAGAEEVYPIYYGPADWFSAVNRLGRQRYSRMVQSPDPERLAPFELQTNPCALNTRPNAATMARRT
jgi:hypothetical protein